MSKEILVIPQTVDECIELAAENLPAGYEIRISIEKHGYGVKLDGIMCNETNLDGGDGMRSDIIEGINIANGFAQR